MRIRKNASKLLGSLSTFLYCPPPPPQISTLPLEEYDDRSSSSSLPPCQLNCSPWDVMITPSNTNLEENGDILGSSIKFENEPITVISSTTAEFTIEEEKIEAEKIEANKEEEKMKTSTIPYCKKNDGKGWHCKRPAQIPHSHCNYHLMKMRSYSYKNGTVQLHGKKQATEGGDESNFSNSYYGFGSWRRKRRGDADVVTVEEDEGQDVAADDDLAGDNEHDVDSNIDDNDEKCNNFKDEEKNRPIVKNRGRRPIKSRSLKSIL